MNVRHGVSQVWSSKGMTSLIGALAVLCVFLTIYGLDQHEQVTRIERTVQVQQVKSKLQECGTQHSTATGCQGVFHLLIKNATPGELAQIRTVGAQGSAGPRGAQGMHGARGAQGSVGRVGPRGLTGAKGSPSSVPGPRGLTGPAGAQGPAGASSTVPGPRGPDGPQGAPGPALPEPGHHGILPTLH